MSLSDTWTKFVANEADIWVEFHRFWMRKRFECPILIVRYEDVMIDKEVMEGLWKNHNNRLHCLWFVFRSTL